MLARMAVGKLAKAAENKSTLVASEQEGVMSAAACLSRLLPILFENEHQHQLVETIFWKGQIPGGAATDPCIPLAPGLMDSALVLMYHVGFTVGGANERTAGWNGGITAGVGKTSAKQLDAGRLEMLKLILISCSQTLFVTPDEYKASENKWLSYYTTRTPEQAQLLLQSLCAVIFSYDPVGMGIPYASALGPDRKESVVDLSVQILIVLLDYVIPGKGGAAAPTNRGVATEQVLDSVKLAKPEANTNNAFRNALRSLSSEDDYSVIFEGFCRLLNNPHQANNTVLPSSMKQISCFQELLILFWKLIDENKEFLSYILRAGDINELVVPMLYFMYEGRKDPSKIGLIHICTFILLLLSGERNFCVNLNAAFNKKLPVDLPVFNGNHADLLYIVINKLMTDGPNKLDTLYDCFLTTMSNVSPYIKTFCMPAAAKATSLFEMFATKRRLVSNEHNPRYLVFTLEVFNNIIQYQYEGNPHFIYQILRRKKEFAELQELVEGGGQEEIAAAQQAADNDETQQRFRPSQEWVKSWAESLPLQPCMRLMQHLLPQLEQFCTTGNVNDETIVVEFLKTTTMVGLLPVPHPILIRKYQQNEFTSLWFTTYIWGVLYLRNQSPPYFDAAHIRLFTISYVDA
eukprot:Tamp_07705.p1 GENE.Tamp_07705~~Tamp_07705.p1  ORF type:complete len:632 (+),score=163.56 Tamp_07705:441-2336(+)